MRKIEEQMIRAILNGKHWQSGNTSVIHDDSRGERWVEVRLYGHLIAARDPTGKWQMNLCGYNTVTTRSRLSAIIKYFSRPGNAGLGVSTKQGQAYKHDFAGKTAVPDNGWWEVVL